MIRGSCLCVRVAYRLEKPPAEMNICHCSMCRKIRGSSYGVFAHTDSDNFHWIEGQSTVRRFESSPGEFQAFCPVCGSTVPVVEASGNVIIPAGTFDDDPKIRPMAQIFAASKAAWHELTESPQAFAEFASDDFEAD